MKKPSGFWAKIPRPIYTLAPMSDVTDAAFRRIITHYGKPDVLFTEFVSCDGLCSVGKSKLLSNFIFDETERPIVAQVFGKKPEAFYHSAQIVAELGFDGIDINMGCPERNVCKQGAGAALIKTPELAKQIILESKRGAGDMPVSVKTRLGFNQNVIHGWAPILLEAEPDVLTVHLRTAKEMSKVSAHWDQINQVIRMAENTNTLIFGNGDVMSLQQADEIAANTGVDGVMFGRAVFGNPWLFDRQKEPDTITVQQRLDAMTKHATLYEKIFGDTKTFLLMRKHLWAYASGFKGAKDLRHRMETVENVADVRQAIHSFLADYPHYIEPTNS